MCVCVSKIRLADCDEFRVSSCPVNGLRQSVMSAAAAAPKASKWRLQKEEKLLPVILCGGQGSEVRGHPAGADRCSGSTWRNVLHP